ncbi:uncharacterized protein E0L32_008325 [Thyridium curvatum]|uniref:Non-haem dioxygenase N-terminal domain-containing protein n=1 Tax=Thyridium curvatum TaxID=1093900 RepID=A0A507AVL5_9PEZI|nr:uncharacterized protein E0L32_008325 [Thyridium curvatum]TPX10756.1 hypothetical protein E0L32_008325 [Thyridium curvatum]
MDAQEDDQIPTADLVVVSYDSLRRGEHAEVTALFSACTERGFFYLDLTGEDNLVVVEQLFGVAKEYFSKPLEEKLKDMHSEQDVFHICGRYPTADTQLIVPEGIRQNWSLIANFIEQSHKIAKTVLNRLSTCLALELKAQDDNRIDLAAPHDPNLASTSTAVLQCYPTKDLKPETSAGHFAHTDAGSVSVLFMSHWGLQVHSSVRDRGTVPAPQFIPQPPDQPTASSPQANIPSITIQGMDDVNNSRSSTKSIHLYKFSILPNGLGYHHQNLARFLAQLMETEESAFQPSKSHDDFVTAFRFVQRNGYGTESRLPRNSGATGPNSYVKSWQLESPPKHLQTCEDLHRHQLALKHESPGQVLFLRGFPSPEWVGLIGSKYHVDPEFFSRYLDFRSMEDRSNSVCAPLLPSREWNIIELSVPRVGLWSSLGPYGSLTSLKSVRLSSAAALAERHHLIEIGSVVPVGSTMIRAIHILDKSHFAVEQKILICLQPPDKKRGWTALVWTDEGTKAGVDFLEGPLATILQLSQPFKASLLPIIDYTPMMGLKAHLISKHLPDDSPGHSHSSALPLDFGCSIRNTLASKDPFYALSEIFTLAASAEKAFLDRVELKLEAAITPDHTTPISHNDRLENLRYLHVLLQRRGRRIHATLQAIRNTGQIHSKWPQSNEESAACARKGTELDMEHLHEQAERLSRHCQNEIAVLMNSIVILESVKAIRQAERVEKITFLAFLFVPMSLVSSFFSMNVPELQSVPLWSWFATSLVLVIGTVGYYLIEDVRMPWKALKEWLPRR